MKHNRFITTFGLILSLSFCSNQTLCKATEIENNTNYSETEEVNESSDMDNSPSKLH